MPGAVAFQSLTWVERLSDPDIELAGGVVDLEFQSLTWVERLSDRRVGRRQREGQPVSIPHLG